MCRKNFHKMLKINDLRTFLSPFLGGWLTLAAVPALLFAACGGDSRGEGSSRDAWAIGAPLCSDSVHFSPEPYGDLLRMGVSCGLSLAEIRSEVGRDTLVKRFVLVDSALASDTATLRRLTAGREWQGAALVQVPLRRVVVLSSAQIGFMLRLGVEDRIVGVGEGKYIVDSALSARVSAGEIAEVGNGPAISLEKVVALKPDLVMTFATGGAYDDYDRLETIGVPLMLTSEWQERTPLAKAEWIKLFGRLFGEQVLADSIFEQSKSAYLRAVDGGVAGVSPARGGSEQQRANEGETSPHKSAQDDTIPHSTSHIPHSPCPRVLVGMSYGGVWHAPGGNSFTARIIKDAGGCYLWADDTTREMKLSLEEVFAVADSADVWVNPGIYGTPEEILAAEPRLSRIRAFREKRVCQNDARKSAGGGNDFYESAVARPMELIKNLRECIYSGISLDSGPKVGDSPYRWYRNIYN